MREDQGTASTIEDRSAAPGGAKFWTSRYRCASGYWHEGQYPL